MDLHLFLLTTFQLPGQVRLGLSLSHQKIMDLLSKWGKFRSKVSYYRVDYEMSPELTQISSLELAQVGWASKYIKFLAV